MPRRTTAEGDNLAAYRSLSLNGQQRARELVEGIMGEETGKNGETWLRREMRARGKMSGRWLAKQIGLSHSQTYRLINGDQPPTVATCHKLAKLFGMDAQEVMRLSGKLPTLDADYDERQERRLVALFQSLDGDGRGMVVRFAAFLVAEGEVP